MVKRPLSPTSSGRRRLPGDVRRRQIMDAAVRLFAMKGFQRTTTREIAAAAGISEGSIYNHFSSKQALLLGIITGEAVDHLAAMMEQVSAKGSDEEVVAAFIEDRLSLIRRRGNLQKIIIGEALFDPRLARAMGKRLVTPVLDVLTRHIAGRIEAGAFRQCDPGLAARALLGGILTLTLLETLLGGGRGQRRSRRHTVRELTRLFLDGTRRRPPRLDDRRGKEESP